MSKTNRPTQKKGRKAVRKGTKKASVHPLTEFEGEAYTGLRNQQTWSLGKGKWGEQRTGAISWDFAFETIAVKPFKTGAGLPVGSEHHSYILAHQKLVKTRNNTYQVRLEGLKFKLAHKEAGEKWSANAAVRKKNLIKILKEALHNLEMGHGQAPSEAKRLPSPTEDMPGEIKRTRRRKNPKN